MTSNTGGNRKPNKGQFKKGDPRINRKGRPKNFDALRELALQIAHEPVTGKDGNCVVISGRKVTVAEMILRKWATSGNSKLQQGFIEVAFGKVPTNIDIKSDGKAITLVGIDPDGRD